ncbi:MAG: hypothetical protein NW241_19885 [Bacteroidia bacterium]|nr:hypothetical protein [Bacteroidia bacterium]
MNPNPDLALLIGYLYGELSPEEHQRAQALLDQHPELAAEVQALRHTRRWLQAADAPPAAVAPPVLLVPRSSRLQRWGWAAAACWLLLLSGWVLLRPAPAAQAAAQPWQPDTAALRAWITAAVQAETAPLPAAADSLRTELAHLAARQRQAQAAQASRLTAELTRLLRQQRTEDLDAINEAFRRFALEQEDARLVDNQRFATVFAKLQQYERENSFAP